MKPWFIILFSILGALFFNFLCFALFRKRLRFFKFIPIVGSLIATSIYFVRTFLTENTAATAGDMAGFLISFSLFLTSLVFVIWFFIERKKYKRAQAIRKRSRFDSTRRIGRY